MFGLFKKKKKVVSKDRIYYSTQEKRTALANDVKAFLRADQTVFVFYYFENTKKWIEVLLADHQIEFVELERANRGCNVLLVSATEMMSSARMKDALRRNSNPRSAQFLFANRYPMYTKEFNLLLDLSTVHAEIVPVSFYVSLDDPLMEVFGSERIKGMLEKMGHKEGEMIQHNMITKSIVRAQEKLEGEVSHENRADSQEEWFQRNLPGRR